MQLVRWCVARLVATRDLTHDIRLFVIDPAEGDASSGSASSFVAPTPGSHIQVEVLIGGRVETRSYSTVGPCADGLYRIAVKRLAASRGGSAYMWSLTPGARLKIAHPRNQFELAWAKPAYLLLAGGIGITPIYSMALALVAAGADVRLIYGVRTAADLAFAEELRAELGDRLSLFVDAEGEKIDLDREIAALAPGGEFYVCGPLGLMDAARQAWTRSGRAAVLMRFETFGNSGRFANQPFHVAIPRLDLAFDVAAEETLLDALEKAGVAMISDCRKGECGLCVLPILSADGPLDHRDVFFSSGEKAENSKICTCVSRLAGGILSLDTPDRRA
ncbi:MAG: PDR/VanB family oxidoreductase [Ancalomicrobiaceae bacterium]|nr:PDR/VanB family oxidoreductase [Ancalomicrobiaceae bacterium]